MTGIKWRLKKIGFEFDPVPILWLHKRSILYLLFITRKLYSINPILQMLGQPVYGRKHNHWSFVCQWLPHYHMLCDRNRCTIDQREQITYCETAIQKLSFLKHSVSFPIKLAVFWSSGIWLIMNQNMSTIAC